MEELKPCPFCGGTPLLSEGPYDWDCGGRYYYSAAVECACGLTLEVDNPGPKVYTSDAEALNFAVAAWNTRYERTCRDLGGCDTAGMQVFNCSECGCVLSLFDVSGANTLCTNHIYDYPRYCPECGAKVIGGVTDD